MSIKIFNGCKFKKSNIVIFLKYYLIAVILFLSLGIFSGLSINNFMNDNCDYYVGLFGSGLAVIIIISIILPLILAVMTLIKWLNNYGEIFFICVSVGLIIGVMVGSGSIFFGCVMGCAIVLGSYLFISSFSCGG